MLFLDPNKPVATCAAETCEGCEVDGILHCHFTLKDLIHFLAMCVPSLLLGGWGIANVGGWFLAPWILFMCGYFWFLEIRVMCSHCPHYAEPGAGLKCWANYGAPKVWKYRPGPMSFFEKFLFLGGFAIIWGCPLYFLISGAQWFLLFVFALSTVGFAMTLKMFLCTQCMNFACPLNAVGDATRRSFFRHNPEVAEAWGIDPNMPASS